MSTMTQASEPRILKVADRGDCCGAQAFVRVELENGMLLFCAHHFARHEKKLEQVAMAIIDEREHINIKPSISANAE